jgi:hypothetical protein
MRRGGAFRASMITIVVALSVAAPAAAAGGPAVPSGSFSRLGVTGPPALPSSESRYLTVTAGNRTVIEQIKTDGGSLTSTRTLHGLWALPAVTILGDAAGLSADGETLVLIKPDYSFRSEQTTLLIAEADHLRSLERIKLDGRFSFDAISPDGTLLYLVQYADPRNPLDYRVRAYDLETGEFQPGKIVDPEEPGEQMSGQPVARQSSPDGRWAYTLYGGGEETFIHALDTEGATAVCVDLDEIAAKDLYMLGLNVDPATGLITVLDRGKSVAIVDPQTFAVGEPPAADVAGAPGAGAEEPGGASWIAWVAVGGGAALICAVLLLLGRRRRNDSDVDEQELERLVRVDSDEHEQARPQREPVR